MKATCILANILCLQQCKQDASKMPLQQ